MLLTLSSHYPKGHRKEGQQTFFVEKCRTLNKVHSFRFDNRWKDGMPIHFWSNSPRVPQSNPQPFNMPDNKRVLTCENTGISKDIQPRLPIASVQDFKVIINPKEINYSNFLYIGDSSIPCDQEKAKIIANNDGLYLIDFYEFMRLSALIAMKKNGTYHERKTLIRASGKIVHWTGCRYHQLSTSIYQPNGEI